jgi:hypothetical protein
VRAIHRIWLGSVPRPPQAAGMPQAARIPVAPTEPRTAAAVLIILAAIALALGFFPGLFQVII